MNTIFTIDDDANVLSTITRWLQISDINVHGFSNGNDALAQIDELKPDAILCDVRMPIIGGLEVLDILQASTPEIPVIMMTGHGDIAMAVKAMRAGAYDFIEKPYDPEHLLATIHRALEKRKLYDENTRLNQQLSFLSGIEAKIIGHSLGAQKLRKNVLGVASFDANTIIRGETGAGKDLVATCLHDYSQRANAPFVAINCGAIPENLLESELFGHEKGAFTGADKKRVGKLEFASEGTLFFDEIESMPMSFQIKLLRALQEKTIERLGSNVSIAINPRVICATKVDLKELSEAGDFRSDLYYRLKVAEISIPSLSQRPDDIPKLFEHFLREAEKNYNIELRRPNAQETRCLCQHPWPGNIRELKNVAHRFAIESVINDAKIDTVFLSNSGEQSSELSPQGQTNVSLAHQIREHEKQLIQESLAQHKGSIQSVMDSLDISRRSLNMKMQQHDLKREDFLNL